MIDPPNPKTDWSGVLRTMSTSSAVNPMLIASIVALIVCVPALIIGPEEIRTVLSVILATVIGVFLLQVMVFTFSNPDRLQNDVHVERKMQIAHQIQLKEAAGTVVIDIPRGEKLVDNPRSLEGGQ